MRRVREDPVAIGSPGNTGGSDGEGVPSEPMEMIQVVVAWLVLSLMVLASVALFLAAYR